MSVVPTHGDGEVRGCDGDGRDRPPSVDGGADARQAAWFGLVGGYGIR